MHIDQMTAHKSGQCRYCVQTYPVAIADSSPTGGCGNAKIVIYSRLLGAKPPQICHGSSCGCNISNCEKAAVWCSSILPLYINTGVTVSDKTVLNFHLQI